jgi:hypothetical protein
VPLNHAAYLVAFSISFVSATYRFTLPLQQGRTNPGTKIVTAIEFCIVSGNVWVLSIELVLCDAYGAWILKVTFGFLEYLCSPGKIQTWDLLKIGTGLERYTRQVEKTLLFE